MQGCPTKALALHTDGDQILSNRRDARHRGRPTCSSAASAARHLEACSFLLRSALCSNARCAMPCCAAPSGLLSSALLRSPLCMLHAQLARSALLRSSLCWSDGSLCCATRCRRMPCCAVYVALIWIRSAARRALRHGATAAQAIATKPRRGTACSAASRCAGPGMQAHACTTTQAEG